MPTSKSRRWRRRAMLGASVTALMSFGVFGSGHADVDSVADHQRTVTPIKHLVVVIGENRSFDHLFATYVSPSGDKVSNLLSKGIIHADGTPGPNFKLARQFQATPPFKTKFFISLENAEKAPYQTLPVPGLNFAPNVQQAAPAPCSPPTA